MKIEVIRGSELSKDLTETWHQYQLSNHHLHNPCFNWEFVSAVASVRSDVYVGIIRDGNDVIGFFPYQKQLLVARPVGGPLSDFQGIIAPDNFSLNAEEIIARCGLATWEYDHLLICGAGFNGCLTRQEPSPLIDLRNGYEAYVEQRRQSGSEVIKKIIAMTHRIERDIGRIEFEMHVDDENVLETLMSWKSAQYRRTGGIDCFEHSWIVKVVKKIHQLRNDNFAGVLSTLRVDDRLIAAHMGMRSKEVLHYWFPAYDTNYSNYSPGLVLLLLLAEKAAAVGMQKIDLGKGDESYKARMMNGQVMVARGRIISSNMLGTTVKLSDKLKVRIKQSKLSYPVKHLWQRYSKRAKFR